MNIVLKIGGHLLFGERVEQSLLKEYVGVLRELYRGEKWVVVVGGGVPARKYVEAARGLGLDESVCDTLAIHVTRVNALLFSHLLGDKAYPAIPQSLEQLREFAERGRIVVMGGLQPGQSTMAVAALAAEAIGAERLIVATDVDGIYTDDPKRNPRAKLLKEITIPELLRKLSQYSHSAGEYKLADILGLKILSRSQIPAIYLNGKNPENIRKAVQGQLIGTLLKP